MKESGIKMTRKIRDEVNINLGEGLVENVTAEVTKEITNRFERMNLILLKEKRYEEPERASSDREYREALCVELGI